MQNNEFAKFPYSKIEPTVSSITYLRGFRERDANSQDVDSKVNFPENARGQFLPENVI